MRAKTGLFVGLAVGYYFGAKAGRERYEQLDATLRRIRRHPRVAGTVAEVDVRVRPHLERTLLVVDDAVPGLCDTLGIAVPKEATPDWGVPTWVSDESSEDEPEPWR
ncbi:MAG: hypothetical protein JJU45_18995 [Acidimicrobiia bacterium]|nr:hypothetical protein [Acidimicrobiia bacterium]